ncbi:MAG: hypothetical protein IKV44_03940 [Clostridia bacterium]|nr:hypothetical protein [Clostridia bacterium]
MKNSDMKVIAIILSIALLFTIITSNAVSIASVILLAKGGISSTASAEGDGATNNGGSTPNMPSSGSGSGSSSSGSGSSSSGSGSSSSGSGSSSSGSGSSSSGSSNTETTAADNGGSTGDNGGASAGPVDSAALKEFQDAAKAIAEQGVAGYNNITWQKPLKIEGLGILDSVIVPILEGFMTTEDEAEVKVNAKGSDDAKRRMPASNCTEATIASCKKEGNTITIVMKDVVNPSYAETDGLAVMSRDFLDYKDVEKEAANIAIVKSLDGQIEYKAYTITAVMNGNGGFESITHYGIGYINATLNGSINATGELEFNSKYTDFVY